jgi:hypothetical protein
LHLKPRTRSGAANHILRRLPSDQNAAPDQLVRQC